MGLIINGCKRKEDETIDEPTTPVTEQPTLHQVNAYVQLPQGSSLNISGLNLNSNVDLVQASEDGVGIDVLGNHYGVYATNAANDVVMIGYGYPGQDSLIVNAESTALALVMLSHAAMSLSDAGKTELVHRVLDDAEFNSLVGTVEASIVSGADIFYEENTVLMNKVVALFESVQTRSTNSEDLPVNVHRSGRNFVFVNGGKAYSTVIGVYNSSDELVGPRITVKGIKIVPTSLWELFQGGGGTAGSPIEHPFQLVGDGDFTIKYCTGFPGFGDGSEEHDIAFYTNINEFGWNLYSMVLSVSNQFPPSCANAVKSQLESIYSNSQAVYPDSQAGVGAILMAVTDLTLSSMGSLIEISQNCSNHSYSSIWFPKLLKHWNFLGTAFGVISNGANTTIFGYHWANAVAVVDECYHAQGNSVTDDCSCETQFTSITDPRDGQVYNTVQIGNQVWFADNLRYSGSIPEVSSSAAWLAIFSDNPNPTTGQPAWCYYLNDPSTDTIYGKLYNWYAAASGGLCPSGWHIPTDAEWTILINHLGGEDVAGGKMKSIVGWSLSSATNESCFSMPFVGWRDVGGGFTSPQSTASLWSSTQYVQSQSTHSTGAWSRSLYQQNTSITRYPSLKGGGFSCRCIQN